MTNYKGEVLDPPERWVWCETSDGIMHGPFVKYFTGCDKPTCNVKLEGTFDKGEMDGLWLAHYPEEPPHIWSGEFFLNRACGEWHCRAAAEPESVRDPELACLSNPFFSESACRKVQPGHYICLPCTPLDQAGLKQFHDAGLAPPEKKQTKKEKRDKPAPQVSGMSMASSTATRKNREQKRSAAIVKRCFEKLLRANPSLSGKLRIAITIQEDGRVGSVNIEKNTTGSDELGKCVEKGLLRLRFPKPEAGEVVVRQNFQLQSGR